jgi:hypothetical protein
MKSIKGKRFLSIAAEADRVYTVLYAAGCTVDISNSTDADIYVSYANSFTRSDGVGSYLTIAKGGGYNGLKLDGDTLYIKTAGSGDITIASRRWA